MGSLWERLSAGVAILEGLEKKWDGGPMSQADCALEYSVLITELWDLEEEILDDPGALLPYVSPDDRMDR